MLALNPALKFYLKQNCKNLPDVQSYNVIGEIKGTTSPDEIMVVGGHLDSWDLGMVHMMMVLEWYNQWKFYAFLKNKLSPQTHSSRCTL